MTDSLSILLCPPGDTDVVDPGPDETYKRDVTLVNEWQPDTDGVVGWSSGGWQALQAATDNPSLARLVIVSLPYPDEESTTVDLAAVSAKTLLLYGSADPLTGARHARLWQKRLKNARIEMVPDGEHDLLEQMWPRVLSYLAPRRKRPT